MLIKMSKFYLSMKEEVRRGKYGKYTDNVYGNA